MRTIRWMTWSKFAHRATDITVQAAPVEQNPGAGGACNGHKHHCWTQRSIFPVLPRHYGEPLAISVEKHFKSLSCR